MKINFQYSKPEPVALFRPIVDWVYWEFCSYFGFQAPEFYKKLGYELEFIREDKDPKFSKYFYLKKL
nr:hypothetical protein [uncultured Butyrivibrio sp.]